MAVSLFRPSQNHMRRKFGELAGVPLAKTSFTEAQPAITVTEDMRRKYPECFSFTHRFEAYFGNEVI